MTDIESHGARTTADEGGGAPDVAAHERTSHGISLLQPADPPAGTASEPVPSWRPPCYHGPWPPTDEDIYEYFWCFARPHLIEVMRDQIVPLHLTWPPPPEELPEKIEHRSESWLHRAVVNLLTELLSIFFGERDVYLGDDTLIYYLPPGDPRFRYEDVAPDILIALDAVYTYGLRDKWVIWHEGKPPDVVIEVTSPSSSKRDRIEKKQIYQDKVRAPEYFWYDPRTLELVGYRMEQGVYVPIMPDAAGRLYSAQLGIWLGVAEATWKLYTGPFLRLSLEDGTLVPSERELFRALDQRFEAQRQRLEATRQRLEAQQQRVEAERQRVEAERRRADEERQRADEERQRADEERQRVEAERRRADEERQRAEEERQRADETHLRFQDERARAEDAERHLQEARALLEEYRRRLGEVNGEE